MAKRILWLACGIPCSGCSRDNSRWCCLCNCAWSVRGFVENKKVTDAQVAFMEVVSGLWQQRHSHMALACGLNAFAGYGTVSGWHLSLFAVMK